MNISHFERMSKQGAYSIERLFRAIRSEFPAADRPRLVRCPSPSDHCFWLLKGMWTAFRNQSDVNHLVGDIHYVALALPGSRTILTIHDLNCLDRLKGLRQRFYRWLYFSLPMRRASIVTAISTRTRDRLVKEFPIVAEKIRVIPDCLPQGFSPHPSRFNEKYPRILHIGTNPNKNLGRTIAALAGSSCVLHVIGALRDEHRSALKQYGVVYHNSVNVSDADIIQAYEQADLVSFASASEGFGMPIIEAQAIGRPILTSNVSPMREVAGEGACLVNPFDVESIRAGFTKIINDAAYRQILIEAGFANVKRFSPQMVARQYQELYSEVAAGRRARATSSCVPTAEELLAKR